MATRDNSRRHLLDADRSVTNRSANNLPEKKQRQNNILAGDKEDGLADTGIEQEEITTRADDFQLNDDDASHRDEDGS